MSNIAKKQAAVALIAQIEALFTEENRQLILRFARENTLAASHRTLFEKLGDLSTELVPRASGALTVTPHALSPVPPRSSSGDSDSAHLDEDSENSSTTTSGSTHSRRRKRPGNEAAGRPKSKKPRMSRHPMLKLRHMAELDDVIADYVQKEPQAILDDDASRVDSDFSTSLANQTVEPGVYMYALMQVRWLSALDATVSLNAVRKCFGWLGCYDLIQQINTETGNNWTGLRFGANVEARVAERLFPEAMVDIEELELSAESRTESIEQFKTCARLGYRLNLLCSRLGESCLLYFSKQLAQETWTHKNLWTEEAVYYEESMEELQKMDFVVGDKENGRLEYAQRLRALFRYQGPITE